jgi:hypothetical protein
VRFEDIILKIGCTDVMNLVKPWRWLFFEVCEIYFVPSLFSDYKKRVKKNTLTIDYPFLKI